MKSYFLFFFFFINLGFLKILKVFYEIKLFSEFLQNVKISCNVWYDVRVTFLFSICYFSENCIHVNVLTIKYLFLDV